MKAVLIGLSALTIIAILLVSSQEKPQLTQSRFANLLDSAKEELSSQQLLKKYIKHGKLMVSKKRNPLIDNNGAFTTDDIIANLPI
jgi:hypothetical protein